MLSMAATLDLVGGGYGIAVHSCRVRVGIRIPLSKEIATLGHEACRTFLVASGKPPSKDREALDLLLSGLGGQSTEGLDASGC